MKRIIIGLMLLAVLMTGMVSVQAAKSEMTVLVRASQTEVQIGDTVEYTVLATGSGVVAMQFNLKLPEGLRYVPNSGATPDNLAQKLGVPAAEWTEVSGMFTFYNHQVITFAPGTEILRFSCVAEKAGQWDVELYELLPFDSEFQEFPAELQVQTVRVTEGAEAVIPTAPAETAPTETSPNPSHIEETVPTVTSPDAGHTEETTAPHTVPEGTDPAPTEIVRPTGEEATQPEPNPNPSEQPGKNPLIWVLLAVVTMIVTAGASVFIYLKKKHL